MREARAATRAAPDARIRGPWRSSRGSGQPRRGGCTVDRVADQSASRARPGARGVGACVRCTRRQRTQAEAARARRACAPASRRSVTATARRRRAPSRAGGRAGRGRAARRCAPRAATAGPRRPPGSPSRCRRGRAAAPRAPRATWPRSAGPTCPCRAAARGAAASRRRRPRRVPSSAFSRVPDALRVRRVRHHARRLADDEQVVVFVEHLERQRLGRRARRAAAAAATASTRTTSPARRRCAGRRGRRAVDRTRPAATSRWTRERDSAERAGHVPQHGVIETVRVVAAIGDERGAGRRRPRQSR